MAIPLEPESGLFPDTLVPPFVEAPEVAELAESVLGQFDEFRAIREALRDDGLRIRYVFETKDFDPTKDEFKPHTIAKVTKAGPLWRCLAETEIVVQFREWYWDRFDEQERRGVLHHEFMHVVVDEAGKVSLAEHDVEEFAKTVRRFGARRGHHAALFKAFTDWSHEQERPEPTPLRVASADAGPVVPSCDKPIGDEFCGLDRGHAGDCEVA